MRKHEEKKTKECERKKADGTKIGAEIKRCRKGGKEGTEKQELY